MVELFGQLYMYFLIFIGVAIGIGFAILGYGFKGFLAGAFFIIALGMISFTFAAIILVVFVNVALKPISKKANKFLIPLIIVGLVIDVFRYTYNPDDKSNIEAENDHEQVVKGQTEYNLDQLDGPAAALVEAWRADGMSDDDILMQIADFMNVDGTELYYDEESKNRIERIQKYKVDGTEHSLKEVMDLLNEQTVWSDIGLATDLVHTQAEYPVNYSEKAHILAVSENSEEPEFKLLMYVDDEIIGVYKIKSNDSEAFNQDAEAALKLMYEDKVNPQAEEAKKNESSAKQTDVAEDEDNSSDVISQGDLDSIPVPGANNTTESARNQIGYLITYYLQAYVDGDTTSLSYYVYPSTPFYSEQERYMQSLKSKGIVLDLVDYNVASIEQLSDKMYEVTVAEYFTIDNPEQGFRDTEQNSKYTVELIDGEFYITGLEMQ